MGDAMDQMTVVEHLQFYARVRGVPDVEHNVREVIRAVGLESFSSRMAAKLSGGNKRKLSLGIALIGNPTVLLLDEPSSGMDAAAKRVMWKTLAAVVPGRSLLLTTHSMEEADALADRAGIMAKRMLAMGTPDGLRHKPISSSDSSFSSSFSSAFSSAAAPPEAAAPPAAGAAPPAPPDGTEANLLEPSVINSWMSLPLSSEIRVERRSSSASIPTDSRTALTSDSDGEVLPPMVRGRYAARCFILRDLVVVLGEQEYQSI